MPSGNEISVTVGSGANVGVSVSGAANNSVSLENGNGTSVSIAGSTGGPVAVTGGAAAAVTVAGSASEALTVTNGDTASIYVTSVGDRGPRGDAGPANSLSVGTITTGAAGSSASATITGTAPSQTLSLTIPRGDVGATGSTGANGTNGKTVELQATSTHVQWRNIGDSSWHNLVSLTAITGPQGESGAAGSNGTNGTNGSSVELQTTSTHIQWRLVGGSTWANLVALSTITGPQGPQGPAGSGGVSWQPVPVSPGASGANGDIAYDASYFYVKSASGWRRTAIATWTPLGAPTSVTATPGDTQATVSWTAPAENGGYAVSDYAVQYSSNGGTTWATFSDGTSTATTATVTGLTNGTAYVFRVAAINAVGTGPYSSATSSVTPGTGDPNFSSVSLLLHMDGSGSTFVDSSGTPKTITANGDATQSTAQSKFGGAAGLFDGDSSLTLASSSAFAFGTGDFVIEFFVRFTSLSGTQGLVCSGASGGLDIQYRGDTEQLGLGAYGDWQASFAWTPSTGAWYYVAISRSSGTVRTYVDGSLVGTEATNLATLEATSADLVIGEGDGFFAGYLDELRVTKGHARGYTGSTISVPTSAFPNS